MRACTGRRKGDGARGKHAHTHVPLETCRRRSSWLRGRAQGALCPSLRGPGGCHLWGTGWMCWCVSLARSEGLALPQPPLQSQEERVSPGRPGSWQPTAGRPQRSAAAASSQVLTACTSAVAQGGGCHADAVSHTCSLSGSPRGSQGNRHRHARALRTPPRQQG